MSSLGVGHQVGVYRIEESVGRGATGEVFRAVRTDDEAMVALKVLRAELSRSDLYVRRFQHEARTARALRHPNLVPVLDTGEAGGRHFLASRYVAGGSVAARIREQGPLPVDDVVRVAADLGAGLGALHRSALVHRDVKPGNALVDGTERVLLTDFGLAKGPAYTVLTRSGALVGTPQYLAPEVIEDPASASVASDVYALGCVVCECLSGAPPFTGGSPLEIALGHLDEEPPDPCVGRDDAPSGFGAVALTALAKDPGERPTTATMYAHMLRLAAGTGS
jgi:serine/threonine protein kinase